MQGYLDNLSIFPAGYFLSCFFSSAGRFCGWFFVSAGSFFQLVFFFSWVHPWSPRSPATKLALWIHIPCIFHSRITYICFISIYTLHTYLTIWLFHLACRSLDVSSLQASRSVQLGDFFRWAMFSAGCFFQLGASVIIAITCHQTHSFNKHHKHTWFFYLACKSLWMYQGYKPLEFWCFFVGGFCFKDSSFSFFLDVSRLQASRFLQLGIFSSGQLFQLGGSFRRVHPWWPRSPAPKLTASTHITLHDIRIFFLSGMYIFSGLIKVTSLSSGCIKVTSLSIFLDVSRLQTSIQNNERLWTTRGKNERLWASHFFSLGVFSAGCIRDYRDHLPPNSLLQYTLHAYLIFASGIYLSGCIKVTSFPILGNCLRVLFCGWFLYQGYKPTIYSGCVKVTSLSIFSAGWLFQLGASVIAVITCQEKSLISIYTKRAAHRDKFESGTSQRKSGTYVNSSNRGIFYIYILMYFFTWYICVSGIIKIQASRFFELGVDRFLWTHEGKILSRQPASLLEER